MNFIYKETSRIKTVSIKKSASSLKTYQLNLKKLLRKIKYEDLESSICLPFDKKSVRQVGSVIKKKSVKSLKYVVVIGIGGSNLGSKAIYDSIRGSFDFINNKKPKLLFLDTISQQKVLSIAGALKKLKHKKDFLLLTISKSGGTTETIANTEILKKLIEKKFSDVSDRMVFVTDKGSKLWLTAKKQKITKIAIPKLVGGRYSVFSAVGLLPLALVGIDTKKLLEGAREAVKDGTAGNLSKNHSLVSATLTYIHNKKGKSIHNTFLFAPELESLGNWYRQLMGESIGKEKNLKKKKIHAGITPIVSIGSTDLHSMAQLYYGGPKDKFTNIVTTQYKTKVGVPKKLSMPGLVDDINGKSIPKIMTAIVGGVQSSYSKHNLPFATIKLNCIDEKELGYYMQFRMIEMMYLAKLLNVNAFDQPSVESYKKETKKLLSD